MPERYHEVTESPGRRATGEQMRRLYQRYCFAVRHLRGGSVLEVACGSGLGLGFLATRAEKVFGGDIDEKNLEVAAAINGGNERVRVLQLDAHRLPFPDGIFDMVLLFEAIYYLRDPGRFLSEAYRVLRDEGILIICTVNRDWNDFHPSSYSVAYMGAPDLAGAVSGVFGEARLYGAFEDSVSGVGARAFSLVKRAASRLGIIPGSLKYREALKRIFIGKLERIPAGIFQGMAEYEEPVPISANEADGRHKVIYALAVKGAPVEPGARQVRQ